MKHIQRLTLRDGALGTMLYTDPSGAFVRLSDVVALIKTLTRYDLQPCEGEGRQCFARMVVAEDGDYCLVADVDAS